MQSHLGETAALITAFCWTFNGLLFEAAGKKVGSVSVNYLRLFIAFALLSITTYITRGIALPIDATPHNWFWLLMSGLVGFVLGDIFLFQAYVEIGSRISLLIMSATPPITAVLGFLIMGERISPLGLFGMFTTLGGISLVILSKNPLKNKVQLNRPRKSVIFACIGALGQALGLILSKLGMGSYNAWAATQIRLIAAFIAFTVIITLRAKWPEIRAAFNNKKAIRQIALGAIFGPFIGVSFSLLAVQHTETGIVSSITSISPVLIIPFSILMFKEKVLLKEIIGAFISIVGVILLFL